MFLFKKKELPKEEAPKPKVEYVSTYVVGIDYYDSSKLLKDLEDELFENDDYSLSKKELLEEYMDGDKVYQYEPYILRFKIVPEPTNPHDPNALKVIVMYDNQDYFIGYVPKTKCKALLKSLENNIIPSLTLVGGKYKQVYDDEIDKDEDDYSYLLEYGIKKGS